MTSTHEFPAAVDPVKEAATPPDRCAISWWRFLCAIAVANLSAWGVVCWLVPGSDAYTIAHLLLSGVYVTMCAYRSFYPRVDLERRVLVDSRWSSIFLGRSAATVAEICFGLQLGLLMYQLGLHLGLEWVAACAWVVPLFITLAQAFCWHSVLTLNHITQAVESSLWALGFVCLSAMLAVVAWHATGLLAGLACAGIVAAALFIAYVLLVDVPMYRRRYLHGKATGLRYLSVAQGLRDAWQRREHTVSWSHWKDDAAWLTPYFSAGVWISLGLVFVPHL